MSASAKLLWHLWVVQSRLPTGDSHYQGSRKKVKFGYRAAPFLFFFFFFKRSASSFTTFRQGYNIYHYTDTCADVCTPFSHFTHA